MLSSWNTGAGISGGEIFIFLHRRVAQCVRQCVLCSLHSDNGIGQNFHSRPYPFGREEDLALQFGDLSFKLLPDGDDLLLLLSGDAQALFQRLGEALMWPPSLPTIRKVWTGSSG
jgi:hypothetical protein